MTRTNTEEARGRDGKKIDAVSEMFDTSFILRAFQPGLSLLRSKYLFLRSLGKL